MPQSHPLSRNHPSSRHSGSANILPFTRFPAATPASRAEIDRLITRGRRLQAQALRAALRNGFHYLVGGCSLRGLRLAGRRQPCC